MKIISEISVRDFEAWSGAKDTLERIIEENKVDEFDSQIEELYPDGLTDTELNDLLWFEEESIFEWLGIHDYTCAECGEPVENDGDLCDDCQALEDEEFENEESDDD